jgi:hypothetical protein
MSGDLQASGTNRLKGRLGLDLEEGAKMENEDSQALEAAIAK